MSHFRLRRADEDDSLDTLGPIPFPTFSPRDDDPLDDPSEDAADRTLRLAHDIEHTLDEVQRRLDTVKEHIDDAFHLPNPDDWPPTAA